MTGNLRKNIIVFWRIFNESKRGNWEDVASEAGFSLERPGSLAPNRECFAVNEHFGPCQSNPAHRLSRPVSRGASDLIVLADQKNRPLEVRGDDLPTGETAKPPPTHFCGGCSQLSPWLHENPVGLAD